MLTEKHPTIYFADKAFEALQNLLETNHYSKLVFLVDENTHEYCLPYFLQNSGELPPCEVLEIEAGEESKSMEIVCQLWEALAEMEVDRNALMVNVGGGVITDIGGFLAGTYLRGIDFVNVPTSLLAMVDASNGGKNGVNLGGLKNRIGLFLEPTMVLVQPLFLETLPSKQLRSGFAEMLKHALIADANYWKQLRQIKPEKGVISLELIKKSIEIKQQIVSQDFKEVGLRKCLNFGHTVGHAIESLSHVQGVPLLHGEAVALGMIAELFLSKHYGRLPEEEFLEATQSIKNQYTAVRFTPDMEALLPLMRSDKKNTEQQIKMALLTRIGACRVDIMVEEERILEALHYLTEQTALK